MPHSHGGVLAKYEPEPPSKYGLSLGGTTVDHLRSGRPVVKFIDRKGDANFKRVVSIQDVKEPESLVWEVITDLENYPKMVEGCDMCEKYRWDSPSLRHPPVPHLLLSAYAW